MTYTSRTIDRDGLRLAIYANGGAKPIVFQHGLTGDHLQAASAVPDGIAHRVLECRGHGASDLGPVHLLSFETFADDLAAMMAAEGIAPCPVGGTSMGAAIAMRLAVTHPDLVSALILNRPAWTTEAAPENLHANRFVADLLLHHPIDIARQMFEASELSKHLAVHAPDNLASLRAAFERDPEITGHLLSRLSCDGPGVSTDDLLALRLPCLITATPDDLIHPVDLAQRLSALIPGATLVMLPSKSHAPADHATALRQAIDDFLKGLPT